jgi:Transcription initiation factor TFIIIB, Brf1 subunit/Transcription initiation factor TFIIB
VQIRREWNQTRSVDNYRRDELAERQIEYYVTELNLPEDVRGMAEQLFNQYVDQYVATQEVLFIELTATAAVYSAAKINETGVTPDAFIDASNGPLSRTGLLGQSKEIASELGLDPQPFFNSKVYTDEFCAELDLPEEITERAKQILDHCDEAGISSGKSPTGWAGAAVYLSCRERDRSTSQESVADVADVSSVTIRQRYQEQQDVVINRECPGDISSIVDWACKRVDLPEKIRRDARAYTEDDLDLSIRGRHDIPLSSKKTRSDGHGGGETLG